MDIDLKLAEKMADDVADKIDQHQIGGLKYEFEDLAIEVLSRNMNCSDDPKKYWAYLKKIGSILGNRSAAARKKRQR